MIAAWIWAPLLAFLGTVGLTRLALAYLERRNILDHPNHRSSHTRPTPRGGGLGVVPPLLLAWVLVLGTGANSLDWDWALPAGGLALMAVSWADDRLDLPAWPRLALHAGIVGFALALLAGDRLVFGGFLPFWADRVVAFLGWLWFVNLFNFMDGIDGISGVETASLGVGIALVALVAGIGSGFIALSLAAAAAGLGFLVWNWHPARIFLGDVGSVPLGFLLGGLLVELAASGYLAAALILPAYYLADATITLLKRLRRGERIWQAHRSHYYQRALAGGRGHDQVARAVLAGNGGLILAALLASLEQIVPALALALAVVAILLGVLSLWSRGR